MCRHLVHGVACGFHAAPDDPRDRWPDAWCDLCNDALEATGGEWTAESEAVAQIKVICTHCYESAKALNERVPPLARGARTQLTPDEADALIHHAVHEFMAANDASRAKFGWGGMAKWFYRSDDKTLTFTDPAYPTVVADVVPIGSFSTKSNTFQWGWRTHEDDEDQAGITEPIRVFGEVRGIERLTVGNWSATEVDGWEMASLAAYLLGAEAIYRPPFDHTLWFMLMRNVRVVH